MNTSESKNHMHESHTCHRDLTPVIEKLKNALQIAGSDINKFNIEILDRGCPHTPTPLPRGKMAIYMFRHDKEILKTGKVGPNSNARFQTQHYSSGSSKSNLAKSLLNDGEGPCRELSVNEIGEWMQKNLHRTDIIIDANAGMEVLSFVESFLHLHFLPKYEGYKSQRG
jgi:hypothetical protein